MIYLLAAWGQKCYECGFFFCFRLNDPQTLWVSALSLIIFFYNLFFPTCGDWDDLRTLCSKTLTLKSWFSLLRRTVSSTFAAGNSPTVYRGFWPTGSFLCLLIASREVAPKRRIVRPNYPCFESFQVGSLLFPTGYACSPKTNKHYMNALLSSQRVSRTRIISIYILSYHHYYIIIFQTVNM